MLESHLPSTCTCTAGIGIGVEGSGGPPHTRDRGEDAILQQSSMEPKTGHWTDYWHF